MLMAQCNIARRIFSGCPEIGGIADTAIGSNRQDLLDRKLGRIPKFDTEGQILPFLKRWAEGKKFCRVVTVTDGRCKFEGEPTPAWFSKC